MSPKRAFGRVLLGLLGISAWVIGSPDVEREIQPKFKASVSPAPQHRTDRSWQPWNWRKVGSIGAAQGLGPVYAHIGSADSLVVLDAPGYAVQRILSSGKIVESIGITSAVLLESSAPITALAPQEDGTMWVCSPNGAIVGFLRDGRVQHTLPRAVRAMRLGVLKDRLIATLVNSDQLFAIYTTAGQAVGRFGEFLEQQRRTPLLVDGWLTVDVLRPSFFFAPRYAGFLASYNLDGTQRFLVQTVDAPPLPKYRVKEDGTVLYPVLSKNISSVAAREGKLYVLVNQSSGLEENKRPTVLDVYNSNDGSYLFSSGLPGHYTEIAVGSNVIYTLGESEIDVWKPLPPSNPGAKPSSKATAKEAK